MSQAGWYPDPGGEQGKFRYWDGQRWSSESFPDPTGTPAPAADPADPAQPFGVEAEAADTDHRRFDDFSDPRTRLWWISGIATLLLLVVVIAFGVRQVVTPGGGHTGGQSSRSVCPQPQLDLETPPPATRDGRVYGGKLSYPTLPPPWASPSQEARIPFGRNAWYQSILVERFGTQDDPQAWVAGVHIAELNAGDGFFTPQEGSDIVMRCIAGAFYGDGKVQRDDRISRATTVDGRQAWLTESHLTFDLRRQGLKTTGELAIVMIVETGEGQASLFYASIPDTSPQWEKPARDAMAQLTVSD